MHSLKNCGKGVIICPVDLLDGRWCFLPTIIYGDDSYAVCGRWGLGVSLALFYQYQLCFYCAQVIGEKDEVSYLFQVPGSFLCGNLL